MIPETMTINSLEDAGNAIALRLALAARSASPYPAQHQDIPLDDGLFVDQTPGPQNTGESPEAQPWK